MFRQPAVMQGNTGSERVSRETRGKSIGGWIGQSGNFVIPGGSDAGGAGRVYFCGRRKLLHILHSLFFKATPDPARCPARASRSVIETEANRDGSGRGDGGSGKDAGKVDQVEAVVKIADIALQAHDARFFLIEVEGGGEIDG